MKTIIIVLYFISCFQVQGQQTKPLDTLYANEKKNVALFFSSPIRQAVTGTDHFIFTYNREKEQYFGLLQATPGVESNLLVVTSDGKVYSYILKYKNELSQLNYFVTENKSIGSEFLEKIIHKPSDKTTHQSVNRNSYFQKFSSYLLESKSVPINTKRKQGITLQLQAVVYDSLETYLILEISNKSGIDFQIDYLNIYSVNGNKKRKASYQQLPINSIFKYNMPLNVKDGQRTRFVYVCPKFVLDNNEKLMIELKELNGNRLLRLKTRL